MAASVLELALDNRRLGEAQLSPLIAAWRSGQYALVLLFLSFCIVYLTSYSLILHRSPSLRISASRAASTEAAALKRGHAALHAPQVWDTRPKRMVHNT